MSEKSGFIQKLNLGELIARLGLVIKSDAPSELKTKASQVKECLKDFKRIKNLYGLPIESVRSLRYNLSDGKRIIDQQNRLAL
jgi:hypothetical protein